MGGSLPLLRPWAVTDRLTSLRTVEECPADRTKSPRERDRVSTIHLRPSVRHCRPHVGSG